MTTAPESSAVRLVATLSAAGLVAGLILSAVFVATQPVIAQNRADALRRAILEVVPGATGFSTFYRDGERLVAAEGAAPKNAEKVYAATNANGHRVGWAIPAQGPGFQDTISFIYGFDSNRRVIIGMTVLDSRETPGLGDKIVSDPLFHANFKALAVEPAIVAVKRGEKTRPNEVDCITGATISSKAVVRILGDSIRHWLPLVTAPAVATAEEKR